MLSKHKLKNNAILLIFSLSVSLLFSQTNQVSVMKNDEGMKLVVDGKDFIVNGINWDYVPVGSTVTDPGIWIKSDEIIKAAIDGEMSLLRNMGVNAIRTYNIHPKWVTYIYENYGIYTMPNITFGAYGLTLNGIWTPQTDYSDPATLEVLMAEAIGLVNTYKEIPGILMYMLGNENNYHLSWTSAETADIPVEGSEDPNKKAAARALYKAFNNATKEIKKRDTNHPVAICNGDLLYLDLVKEECTDIDIYGTNMYRGISFWDAFQRVKDELNMPIMFAEFGSDAYNARDNQEDQYMQAYYNVGNWKDIYQHTAGLGKVGNCIGGFTFQFSDGWWKWNQTINFDIHDTIATWNNGGYSKDQNKESDNNMNEEWFGICAKGPTDSRGLYKLYPRAAYYALKEVHQFNPYKEGITQKNLNHHFKNINLKDSVLKAHGDKASFPFTFEEEAMLPFRAFDNGATIEKVANSNLNGNHSASVLEFNKVMNSAWYSGFVFDDMLTATPIIDLVNGTIFTLKICSPKAGVNVRVKMEDMDASGAGNPSFYVDQTIATANEWVTLTFDFGSQVDSAYTFKRIAIFPDFDDTNQVPVEKGAMYLIDDITQH
jgi:hypothetical protein